MLSPSELTLFNFTCSEGRRRSASTSRTFDPMDAKWRAIAKAVVELTAAREAVGRTMDGFEVIPIVPVSVADDVAAAAEPLRKRYAQLLAVGGDGENFYRALARNLGFDREMDEFTDRIGRGDLAGAAATVPLEFVEGTALLGPLDRIARRMRSATVSGDSTLR